MAEAAVSKNNFLTGVAAWPAGRRPAGPPWLQKLRRDAAARFKTLGLPGPRDEEWRQTSVSGFANTAFALGSDDEPASLELPAFCGDGAQRLVFVNGRFSPSYSSLGNGKAPKAGVEATSLARTLTERPDLLQADLMRPPAWTEHPFAWLNTAWFEDGAHVVVADGTVLEQPIYVVHVVTAGASPVASLPRTVVRVGRHCQLQMVEAFVALGQGASLTAAFTEVIAGEESSITHVRIQDESAAASHFGLVQYRQTRASRVHSLQVSFGAALARYDIGTELAGEGAECTLDGLYLTGHGQHADHHTTIDHAAPHCNSHEMYKGVLFGGGRAVFNGRIIVRQGAQKTDAKQSNRNLLLSGEALVHTRPQLEIYADDVKCTHGATIGRLDAEALFYLRSRGLSHEDARNILIHAFTAAVLGDEIPAGLRTILDAELLTRLAGREQVSA